MKKIKTRHWLQATSWLVKVIGVTLSTLMIQAGQAQGFEEGRHYTQVKQSSAIVNKQESGVVEYFSFSCAGCFAFEPSIMRLKADLPSLNFRRVHMPYGGRQAKFSQKAYALMVLLKAENHKDRIFNRLHLESNVFDSDTEIINFFESLGYKRELLEGHLNSFSADTMIRKMNKEAVKMQIKSVPSIIVNGRYQINIRAISDAKQFSNLVAYLYTL